MEPSEFTALVQTVGDFVENDADINVALSAVQLLWDLLERVSREAPTPIDDLMQILAVMYRSVQDPRYDIWSSTGQTLPRALANIVEAMSPPDLERALTEVLVPTLGTLRTTTYARLAGPPRRRPSRSRPPASRRPSHQRSAGGTTTTSSRSAG